MSKLKGSNSLSSTFRTFWDEDYLHVLVDVNDVTFNTNDKVELFIDENNAKSSEYRHGEVYLRSNDRGNDQWNSLVRKKKFRRLHYGSIYSMGKCPRVIGC